MTRSNSMLTGSLMIAAMNAAVLQGCLGSHDAELTKAEARAMDGKNDAGADLCEIWGWYGDGVCDDFCPEVDRADCAATCLALPSCEPGETAVESPSACPQDDASCREVTVCGATIWCTDAWCSSAPACVEGERAVSSPSECPQDASCREVVGCGGSIWCTDAIATCLAYPSCNAWETAYTSPSECPQDATCRAVSLCGSTLWCADTGANCAAVPSCEPGETPYASASECPQDGASCRAVTVCGSTLWCSDTRATCLALPTCEPDETAYASASECPQDRGCRPETRCGSTIWCSGGGTCPGPNPAGCLLDADCDAGQTCETGTRPSTCSCSDSGWLCTADLSGGHCVDAR